MRELPRLHLQFLSRTSGEVQIPRTPKKQFPKSELYIAENFYAHTALRDPFRYSMLAATRRPPTPSPGDFRIPDLPVHLCEQLLHIGDPVADRHF